MTAVSGIFRIATIFAFSCGVAVSGVHAAPRKKPVQAKPMSNTEFLAKAAAINKFTGEIPSPLKCDGRRFSFLADGLAENADWISDEKSEFETTAQFNEKIEKRESLLKGMGPFLACFSFSGDHPVTSKYDADNKYLEFTLYSKPRLYSRERQLGSVAGRTVGGVAFRYDRELEWDYDIDLDFDGFREKTNCLASKYGAYVAKISMDPRDALMVKYAGGLYFSVDLKYPFSKIDNDHHRASLTEAWQSETRTVTAIASIKRMFVVDASGKILWECGLDAA